VWVADSQKVGSRFLFPKMLQGMVAILEVHWVLKAIDSQLACL
jgi:hypothetical protein